MRVACVGAGPAGLYLAILLKRRDPRHEVTVYERGAPGEAPGWGVTLWEELVRELCATDPDSGRDIEAAAFRWRGLSVSVADAPPLTLHSRGLSIARERLLEALGRRARALGVRLAFEREIADASELPGADLVVASDGAGSRLRRQQAERFGTRIVPGRNKYVWLGTTRVFDAFTIALERTEAGWIWFYGYAYDPAASTCVVECAPETWAGLGFDRLGPEESLARLEHLFARHLGGHRLLGPARSDGTLPWLNFRWVTNERWHAGNVVLAGDAAHTAHFSLGPGTRLAMQDAIALADALHGHAALSAALEAYERTRKAALAPVQRDARLSAGWFEHVARYGRLPPRQFAALLVNRCSPLMPRLPPRLYYVLHEAAKQPTLRRLRAWTAHAAPTAEARP